MVLVTGATKGIGLAAARAFLEAGESVIGTGRRSEDLKKLRGRLGPRFTPKQVDLSNRKSLRAFCSWVASREIKTLICNAGANRVADIRDVRERDWDYLLELNLTAPALLSGAAAKGMARRGFGRIVCVSSIFGLISRRGRAAYSATKSGLIGLVRAMSLDLADRGVLVNAVCPGFTDTELTRSILVGPALQEVKRSIPLGRLAEPREIAELVRFLGSSENTYVTGQAVLIDGGVTIL